MILAGVAVTGSMKCTAEAVETRAGREQGTKKNLEADHHQTIPGWGRRAAEWETLALCPR